MINELPGFWISWSLKNCDIMFYKPKLEYTLKIFIVLAEFVLWEFSIVPSLLWCSILVQPACNDRAWLTSEVLKQNGAGRYAQVPLSQCTMNSLNCTKYKLHGTVSQSKAWTCTFRPAISYFYCFYNLYLFEWNAILNWWSKFNWLEHWLTTRLYIWICRKYTT